MAARVHQAEAEQGVLMGTAATAGVRVETEQAAEAAVVVAVMDIQDHQVEAVAIIMVAGEEVRAVGRRPPDTPAAAVAAARG